MTDPTFQADDVSTTPPPPSSGGPDSTLVNAAKQLVTAKDKALAAGQKIAPEDADAFIRQQTGGKYGVRDAVDYLNKANAPGVGQTLLDKFENAATFGFAPKILGGMSAIYHGLKGDEPASDAYSSTRDIVRGELGQEQQYHPTASLVGELGGDLAGGAMLPTGGPARTLVGAVAKGAGIGAGAGALRGAGETVGDLGDYARNATTGAVLGGATGGALGAVGQVGGKALAKLTNYAGPKYAAAFEEPEITDPSILQDLDSPEFKAALDYRTKLASLRGEGPSGPSIGGTGPNPMGMVRTPTEGDLAAGISPEEIEATARPGGVSLKTINDVKQGLDDQISDLLASDKTTDRQLGRALAAKRNAFLAKVDAIAPSYSAARAAGAEGLGSLTDIGRAAINAKSGTVGGAFKAFGVLKDMPASQRGQALMQYLIPGVSQNVAGTLLPTDSR